MGIWNWDAFASWAGIARACGMLRTARDTACAVPSPASCPYSLCACDLSATHCPHGLRGVCISPVASLPYERTAVGAAAAVHRAAEAGCELPCADPAVGVGRTCRSAGQPGGRRREQDAHRGGGGSGGGRRGDARPPRRGGGSAAGLQWCASPSPPVQWALPPGLNGPEHMYVYTGLGGIRHLCRHIHAPLVCCVWHSILHMEFPESRHSQLRPTYCCTVCWCNPAYSVHLPDLLPLCCCL